MKEQKKNVNNQKKPMKTWKKIMLFFIAQMMLVTAVLLAYNFVTGTQIQIDTTTARYRYSLDPFEKKTDFFESDIFERVFESSMEEITEYSVVCQQMETKGFFDGKKRIDITEFANRKNQTDSDDVTAVFYLEDLLKWAKYGMEYKSQEVRIDNYNVGYFSIDEEENASTGVSVTEASDNGTEMAVVVEDGTENPMEIKEVEAYPFYPGQSVSANDFGDSDGYYTPSVWMQQSIDYYTSYADFTDIREDEDGRVWGNVYVLQCRYKTVDGKNLEELVNNWRDYFTLIHNLDCAIVDLNINYQNYQDLSEIYGEEKSNLKFCVRMGEGSNAEYLSNLPELNGHMVSEEQITGLFTLEFDKYLYYSPSDMICQTNTSVQESKVFEMITAKYLEYAYPESTKLWFGIDREFSVDDAFSKVCAAYEHSNGIPVESLAVALVLVIAYAALMIFLCCKAGWVKNEEDKVILRLNAFDRIHTEFVLVFSIFIAWLGCFLWYVVLEGYDVIESLIYEGIRWGANLLIGSAVLISGAVFNSLFLSLVRRIKGKNLFTDSMTAAIINFIREKWMKSVQDSSDGKLSRYWGFYLGYLIFNFMLVAMGFYLVCSGRVGVAFGVLLWGAALAFDLWIGFSLIRSIGERCRIIAGINRIRDGEIAYQVTEEMHGENRILADAVNNIGDGIRKAVETSMKDERLKADLITNVSHDIKTPLTSIINYVDLLKREDIQDEKLKGYIDILDSKSQRLKQLTEDLVEASKISSGNVSYVFERINLTELLNQAIGEFSEKFESKGLTVVDNLTGQNAYIEADSRRMWRVIENLFNNAYKYALPGTRIYLTMVQESIGQTDFVNLSIKNISAQPLNIDASELTERFIRGDVSRSTEGSGLGLSIAKNLTQAQHGKFDIYLDGDLFKVTLTFPIV